MRIARFETGGRVAWGVVEPRGDGGSLVREIAASTFDVIASRAVSATGFGATSTVRSLADVRLMSPCAPSKIFALAHNYRDHLQGKAPPRDTTFSAQTI